jgi:Spy/CpxP family protein refolding chaperone
MTMKAMILVTAVVLAVGLMAGAATEMHVGHGGNGPHGPEGAMAVPQMVSWLVENALDVPGVSDSQRSRLQAIKDRLASQGEALQAAHAATHEEFKRQWDADTMDTARLHTLVDARVEDLRRMLQSSVDGLAEVHDTLTPEQRRAVVERLHTMHSAK